MREEERAAVRRRGQHQEGGASLVEFALVVPLLAMFLFGIVQFGLAYDLKQSVNSAAREGARMAAIPDEANVTYSTVRARADDSFAALVGDDDLDSLEIKVVTAGSDPAQTRKTCDRHPTTLADRCTTSIPAAPPSDSTKSPCSNQAGQTVVVTVQEKYEITIPFFGVHPVTLTGEGEFRCEIDA